MGFALLAAAVGPTLLAAQVLPCVPVTPIAVGQLTQFQTLAASTDSVDGSYRRTMGIDGVPPAEVMLETDSVVCSAVTNALRQRWHFGRVPRNPVVIRAGPRFLVLNPDYPFLGTLLSMTRDYRDFRMSMICGGDDGS